MGKDFRIGLLLGMVLVVVALIWVATRPGLNPQARMPRVSKTDVEASAPVDTGVLWDEVNSPPPPGPSRRETADAVRLPPPEPAPSSPPPGIQKPPSTALPDQTIYEQMEKIKTTRFHIVRPGETLSGIARQYYGVPEGWQKILKANQKAIKDANKLTPGTKLIIPD